MVSLSSSAGTDSAEGVPELASCELIPWYALRVRANQERTVQRHLQAMRCEEFLPTYQSRKQWSDRIKTTERPLFPGYLFARVEDVPAVLSVNGVCGLLGGNLSPAILSPSEIESVQLVVKSLLPIEPAILPPFAFAPGEKITVREGALRGCTGIVQRHSRGTRLIVSIEMLQRGVAVEIEAGILDKVTVQ
jgi:transcription antitermination factor NusG